ncbi:MAG: gliding motility-associated-like protein [Polaribacter sp.]|jgi:gliding motility-associated-like protein
MAIKTGWMVLAILLLQGITIMSIDLNAQGTHSLFATQNVERFALEIIDNQQLSLCGLEDGERYALYYNKDLTNLKGKLSLHSNDANALEQNGAEKGLLTFKANASCIDFLLEIKEQAAPNAAAGRSSPLGAGGSARKKVAVRNTPFPVMLSLECITCSNNITAFTTSMNSMTPIVTDDSYTPQQLVQEVFVGGDCFTVDAASIIYSGQPQSIGYYSNGTTSVNMEDGVMLLTGNITTAIGPNNANNGGGSTLAGFSDPDLSALLPIGTNLRDVTALEFDFTPTTDNISFEFVFASEEYCEYVGSMFNDVFGFFISGPGINGPFTNNAANIALLPGTNANVAINNVNHVDNNNFYINNMTAAQINGLSNDADCDGQAAVDGAAINDLQFDGLTTVLTAQSTVQACETYHIKLVIADVGDALYDSAVFFKANSFDAGGNATVDIQSANVNVPNTVYENCGSQGFFIFNRSDDDLSQPLIVNYQVAPQSTAIAGVDYATLPNSITIPAGDSIYYLPVDVFNDALLENAEFIRLELEQSCSCDMPFVEMQIVDQPALEVSLDGAALCDNSTMVTLAPQVSGGLPGYQYLWSNNEITPTIDVFPNTPTTYSLTVTDECGNEIINTADVIITSLPTASISGNEEICPGGLPANLQIDFTGNGPWDFSYSVNNAAPININNISENPYSLETTDLGNFELTAIAENGCEGTVQGMATVTAVSLNLTSATSEVTCTDVQDGSINVLVTNGEEPYVYQWDNPLATGPNPNNLPTGEYNLLVTDANGCTIGLLETVALTADVPTAEAGVATDLTCTTTQFSLAGTGSSGLLYSQQWTTTDGNIVSGNNDYTPLINQPGTYVLEVTNIQTACTISDFLTVNIDTLSPAAMVDVLGPLNLDCMETSTVLAGTGSQSSGQIDYLWSTMDGSIPADQIDLPNIEVQSPGTYQLEVTNSINGCTDMDEMTITQDVDLPQVTIAPVTLLTCDTLETYIDATASSNAANFSYSWTTANGNILQGNNGLTPLVNELGEYNIVITNTNNNCTQSGSITVDQDISPPIADAGSTPDLLDCNTLTVNLDGSNSSVGPVFTYDWATINGNILSGNNTLSPLVDSGGVYTLTIENQENGCQAIDEVTVEENPEYPTDLDLEVSPPLCHGDNGTVAATQVTGGIGPYLYSIDEGQNFYGDTLFYNLPPSNVSIVVQDINGCQFAAETWIPNVQPLQLTLEAEATISLGATYQLRAFTNIPDNKIDTIIWSPDETLDCSNCLDPIAGPVENTLYEIILLDTNGCLVEAEIFLRVDKERNVFIPNAFSPNGDGNNDVFMIFANNEAIKSVNELQLFNRWGEKVFQQNDFMPNDPDYGWDGLFKGKIMNPSVLVYFAEIEFVDGYKKMYKGDVTLMR